MKLIFLKQIIYLRGTTRVLLEDKLDKEAEEEEELEEEEPSNIKPQLKCNRGRNRSSISNRAAGISKNNRLKFTAFYTLLEATRRRK